MAPVPSDPLELATGPIQLVSTHEGRDAILKLLARANESYHLRQAGAGYDIKVSFTANSGGVTRYDGEWQLEEQYDPKFGRRWTASTAGFSTTHIRSTNLSYGDSPESNFPLVLHEARGTLFGSMPAVSSMRRDVIRTTTGTLNGEQLTCVLLSGAGSKAAVTAGRNWEETEECIDPQSGLLVVHSLAPGRYALFDYVNAPNFHGHILPRRVTLTEGGRAVIEVRVDSLEDLPSADPGLFEPTADMKARGAATEEAGAYKIAAYPTQDRTRIRPGTIEPVVVFGVLGTSGQILEAHSLQPLSPNSRAAVEAAKAMVWHISTAPGAAAQEHFVFVTEKFVSEAQ